MILSIALLINYLGLFFLEIIGYHLCHSIVMVLNGYYHLCQVILCTVRIVSQRIQFTYTPRLTYGLARVGVVGELVAFVSFLSLSISIFLESIKHLYDVFFVIPKRETNSSKTLTAHGHEHVHSLYDRPEFILGVGVYSMISNCILAVALLFAIIQRSKQFKQQLKQRRASNKQPIPKNMSDSLLITDTLPIQHSFLQILSMLLGPLALLTCGILLFILPHKSSEQITYQRAVDPLLGCLLFSYYLFMLIIPIREVVHLVLQAKPYGMNSDDIESRVISSVPGVVRLHELHIWRLTPQKTLATVHVVFNTTENILTKYQTISFIFQTYHIDHVTIQPEFALSAEEIDKLDCHYQCSAKSVTCSPLQCCEISPAIVPGTNSSPSQTMHFRRRSSIDLNHDSDIETEQEKKLIDNSRANTSAQPLTNSSVVVTTTNEK